ncbi:MAG: hypothetical protein AAGB93_06755 [Planctomycetota bacterium]
MRARLPLFAATLSLLTASAFAGDHRVTIRGDVFFTVPTPIGAPFTNITVGAPFEIVAEVESPPVVVTPSVFEYPLDTATGGVTIAGVTYPYLANFGGITLFDDQIGGDLIILAADLTTPGPVLTLGISFTDPAGGTLTSPDIAALDGQTLLPSNPQAISLVGGLQDPQSTILIGLQGTEMRFEDLGGGGGGFGVPYCNAAPNSTGVAGTTRGTGSTVASANNVTLEAASLPTNAFGFFLTSQSQGFVQMPGGSSGNLCLGGNIGRYVGSGQILNSGNNGMFVLQLDLTQTPTPNGLVSVQAGETWNFTAWFRDSVGGTATSNFTDGLSVAFQ